MNSMLCASVFDKWAVCEKSDVWFQLHEKQELHRTYMNQSVKDGAFCVEVV
jgi:hypothetical protein